MTDASIVRLQVGQHGKADGKPVEARSNCIGWNAPNLPGVRLLSCPREKKKYMMDVISAGGKEERKLITKHHLEVPAKTSQNGTQTSELSNCKKKKKEKKKKNRKKYACTD